MTDRSDVAYGRANGRDLLLDIFTPDEAVSRRTAVLLFHGGGWRAGSRKNLAPHAELLRVHGFTALPVEYRLTGESPWPAQIHDVKAAIRWVRSNAAGLGVDPDKLVLQGFSAGAHLSLLAAGTPRMPEFEGEGGHPDVDDSVAAVVAFYPPTAFHTGEERESGTIPASALLGEGAPAAVVRQASPLAHVSPSFPPTFFLHGGADRIVPTSASVVMYEALRSAGVPADLHIFSGQTHGFDHIDVFRESAAHEISLFIRRTVSDKTRIDAQTLEQSMFARRQAEAVTAGGGR